MRAQSTHLENVLCALLNSACVLFEKGAKHTGKGVSFDVFQYNTCAIITGVCSLILHVLCMLKAYIS